MRLRGLDCPGIEDKDEFLFHDVHGFNIRIQSGSAKSSVMLVTFSNTIFRF